jgi:hypothetical protein
MIADMVTRFRTGEMLGDARPRSQASRSFVASLTYKPARSFYNPPLNAYNPR